MNPTTAEARSCDSTSLRWAGRRTCAWPSSGPWRTTWDSSCSQASTSAFFHSDPAAGRGRGVLVGLSSSGVENKSLRFSHPMAYVSFLKRLASRRRPGTLTVPTPRTLPASGVAFSYATFSLEGLLVHVHRCIHACCAVLQHRHRPDPASAPRHQTSTNSIHNKCDYNISLFRSF